MSSLHLVNKSAFKTTALKECLSIATAEDSLLLLEDGVYNALSSSPWLKDYEIPVYAIAADLEARGINPEHCHNTIQAIDYEQFVELSCQYKNSINWS